MIGSLPLGVALYLLRDDYLALFGSDFTVGSSALAILIVSQLLNVAAGPVGILLVMCGGERLAAVGVGCGVIANIALNAVLNPILGLTGAAIASLVSVACWNGLLILFSVRRLRVVPSVLGDRLSVMGG
jgi:O-antigen/teichoic acid export membrane protein